MSRSVPAVMVKLLVAAGQASPAPPVGPALGSKGVKSIDFCKEFNARTSSFVAGTPMPCRIWVRGDRSFTFDVRTPQASHLLLIAANAPEGKKKGSRRGANNPGHETIGTISLKHVYEIAKIKISEPRHAGKSLEGFCRSVIHQARSMGINVVP
ncbi:hypothetical protein MKZ38_002401 [Zalerion maritima]|uniref:Large ribosomal subunit protein uL11m n=1 Tax=Zalerion maritima TaxID=339359 RepID=A0AAD5WRB9_9PEZI|nr:hypothetical protein MKZ38_002401 [Zalerion maritima]